MKVSTLLLAFVGFTAADGRSLRASSVLSGNKEVHLQDLDLPSLLQQRISDCRADPSTCGSAIDQMGNQSDSIEDQVKKEVNETQEEFKNIALAWEGCKDLSTGVKGFQSGFQTKVAEHRECRKQQQLSQKLTTTRMELKNAATTNKSQVCGSTILTQPIANLQDMCKPAHEQDLGTWLSGMAEQFKKKHGEWDAKKKDCDAAARILVEKNIVYTREFAKTNNKTKDCGSKLDALESAACSWATGSASRCSGYESCYDNALARFNTAKTKAKEDLNKWKQNAVYAAKTRCIAGAISSTGATVDAEKMKKCNSKKLADTKWIKLTIPKVPAKKSCPTPSIYPGSKAYRASVYSGLPKGVSIRPPALCRAWMGGCAARSTFGGAVVYLKLATSGVYCRVSGSSKAIVCDASSRAAASNFKFAEEKKSCVGAGSLMSVVTKKKCRYDLMGSGLSVSCAGKNTVGGPAASLNIESNPVTTGRSGLVRLKFSGVQGALLSASSWSSGTPWDGTFRASCSRGGFRAWYSHHHNGREDRSFKWRCQDSVSGLHGVRNGFSDAGYIGQSGWDERLQMECSSRWVLRYVYSQHHNGREDRIFKMWCNHVPQRATLRLRSWTGWTNDWDRVSRIDCGSTGFLVGMISYHSNKHEDRRWRYRCADVSFPTTPESLSFQVEYADA